MEKRIALLGLARPCFELVVRLLGLGVESDGWLRVMVSCEYYARIGYLVVKGLLFARVGCWMQIMR